MERIHILDGYGYIFRAYYGMAGGRNRRGATLSNDEGLPTGALHVYTSMLLRLHQDVRPDRVVVVFDAPGRNFRDDLDENYKATRKETPEDLKAQFPYFRPVTEAFCWPVVSVSGVEADDTIATIANQAKDRGWEVVIYSGDKDLMQLVDNQVTVVDSMRGITYDTARVHEKFGVLPEQLGDWLALVGDSSDNVPGMKGVGKVGATKLLVAHESLRGILENVDEMKGKMRERFCDAGNLAQLELSKTLVTLKTDVELPEGIDEYVPREWESSGLEALFEKFGFTGLLSKLAARGEAASPKAASASRAVPRSAAPAAATAAPAVVAAEKPRIEPEVACVLETGEQLESLIRAAREKGVLTLQAEGDGTRHDRERLVGLGLMVPGAQPYYLSIAHRYLGAPPSLGKEPLASLAELLADPKIAIHCHDSKRTRTLLKREGIGLEGVRMDVMLAAYLLDPAGDHNLVRDALLYAVDSEIPLRESLTGKGKKAVSWELVEVGHAAGYIGALLCSLYPATKRLEACLREQGMGTLFFELELPLARVLSELEARGIKLDEGVLDQLRDEVGASIAGIETRVFEAAGGAFNLGSPKQLSKLLFETLGLQSSVMKKTKTGFSTDHEVLEGMIGVHEIVEPIMAHRELVKLKGTYIDALPPLVNPKTGRLHTRFRQDVAATGRLSSQDPNIQNIPIRTETGRSIRRAFVAPEGHVLVSADYSQIELRIMAHLSEDPVLTRAFVEGIDVHTQTAAEVFSMPIEEIGGPERRVAKAVNYGLIYGQSAFGLARALGISRGKAAHYIETYFERFSKVREFMNEIVSDAAEAGAAFTVCGRKRPIVGLTGKNQRARAAAERVAQNTPMQGSAADIMKLAMLRVATLLKDENAEMLLTVHDELIIEARQDEAPAVAQRVKEAMEQAYELRVPLVVDVGIATSWADAH
ncbi:MAG: DNA polymerase I [Myxococcales bacterium]|nr:DNA polymerase I [Myxococcales bacterium]